MLLYLHNGWLVNDGLTRTDTDTQRLLVIQLILSPTG